MNKDSKNISSSMRGQISNVKSYILDSNGRGFDGDGYVFKTAVKELRKSGHIIIRDKKLFNYKLIKEAN